MSPADLGQSDNDFNELPIISNDEKKARVPEKSMISDELDKVLRRNIEEFENNFNQNYQPKIEESPPKTQINTESQPQAIKYIDDFDSDEDQDITEHDFEIINYTQTQHKP